MGPALNNGALFNIGAKMITFSITNITAATMLMFMIGCEKEEAGDSAVEEPAEEEQEEATVRYH